MRTRSIWLKRELRELNYSITLYDDPKLILINAQQLSQMERQFLIVIRSFLCDEKLALRLLITSRSSVHVN